MSATFETAAAEQFGTFTCERCGHTAPNLPTSGYVDENGAHHSEDTAQAHARHHIQLLALGL